MGCRIYRKQIAKRPKPSEERMRKFQEFISAALARNK